MVNFTITQNVQVIKEFKSVTTEGKVSYDTVGLSYSWLSAGNQTYCSRLFNTIYRGYIEWDITKIKHASSVQSVHLIADMAGAGGSSSDYKSILGGQPSVIGSAQDLYGYINSGTTYVAMGGATNKRYYVKDLGAQAVTDIFNSVSATTDFFAIGLQKQDESAGTGGVLWSRSSAFAEPNNHILRVKYTVNNVVTIVQPSSVSRSNNRLIDLHQFKSGNFQRKDVGQDSKTIRMSGTVWGTNSETSLSNIDDMLDLGEAVVLSGFGDASLNDTWLIESYIWDKEGGYDDVHYDWELILTKPSG